MNYCLFLGLFFVCVSFGLVFDQAYGFIEIKRYKVINSPDVCGKELCSITDEQKAKMGLSKDIMICGDRPCLDARPTYSLKDVGTSLRIEPFFINNQKYLLFKGSNWHNLHNVEVKITNGVFETSMRAQTDDRGNLYMLWPIPKTFEDGSYNVFATDGIHRVEMVAVIEANKDISIKTNKADRCSSTKSPIDWSGCDLYGRVLTKVDLRMANLRNANLYGATLVNKDLSGADLSYAVLKKVNLDGSLLDGANLSHSNMIDAKVRGADLSNAKLRFAKLYRTDFARSNLSNADFEGASMSYANLSFADLKGANFEKAGMWAVNLNHCKNHQLCK
ncbi:MAG TPA: pentapeptide repeat-containing protein [Candidatus Nitrosotenuis sp.]|nr:pentapeptide repeat-containing protein [Candidatus Nitrosotenuis sp.]